MMNWPSSWVYVWKFTCKFVCVENMLTQQQNYSCFFFVVVVDYKTLRILIEDSIYTLWDKLCPFDSSSTLPCSFSIYSLSRFIESLTASHCLYGSSPHQWTNQWIVIGAILQIKENTTSLCHPKHFTAYFFIKYWTNSVRIANTWWLLRGNHLFRKYI